MNNLVGELEDMKGESGSEKVLDLNNSGGS